MTPQPPTDATAQPAACPAAPAAQPAAQQATGAVAGPRRVVTDGLVARRYHRGISRKSHTVAWKVHRADCRYAGAGTVAMADLVEMLGHDHLRTKIAVGGAVTGCAVCAPVLLAAAGA